MRETRPEPVFPVGFDEDALAEDLERLSEGALDALDLFRKELRREGGIPQSRLKACHDEGQDGTMLGGCVKTYIEEGSYWADVPELPGCFAFGNTLGELFESLEEGVALYLAGLEVIPHEPNESIAESLEVGSGMDIARGQSR